MALAACLALPQAWAAAAGTTGAPADVPASRLDSLLQKLDISAALAAYDEEVHRSGPSREMLARIARADLTFCLQEGRGWDRLEAVRVLAGQKEPAARAALLAYLDDPASTFRVKAMALLAEQGADDAVGRLRGIAGDAARLPYERIQAASALARFGEKAAAVNVVRAFVSDPVPGVRAEAAAALAAFGDPAAIDPLKQVVKDPIEPTALTAAYGLLRLGDAAGRERLMEGLKSENARVALLAAWNLAMAGDRGGLERARGLVEKGMALFPRVASLPYELDWAAYVLSWIDPEEARPHLVRLTGQKEWLDGRLIAARRLAELGDAGALPVLAGIYAELRTNLMMSPYRADAVRYAGWLGDRPDVRELARQAASDTDPAVRQAALRVLALLGDDAALPVGREFLGGPSLLQRSRAAESLLAFGRGADAPPPPPAPPAGAPRKGANGD